MDIRVKFPRNIATFNKECLEHSLLYLKKCLGAPVWLNKVPQGLRKLLSYIKENYGDPDIYITENGWSEKGEEARVGEAALNDTERVGYYKEYINEALKATLLDGVKLKGKRIMSSI